MVSDFATVLAILFAVELTVGHHHPPIDDDDFLVMVHQAPKPWKAERNFDKRIPIEHFRRISGGALRDRYMAKLPVRNSTSFRDSVLPEEFDGRIAWVNCPSMKEIRDQGSCGSSWAFAVAGAITDKLCLFEREHFYVSVQHLLTCCPECGYACVGGYTSRAWTFWAKGPGILSGRDMNDEREREGCQPYSIEPCHVRNLSSCSGKAHAPRCSKYCNYDREWLETENWKNHDFDLTKTEGHNIVRVEGEHQIKWTIFHHGPVSATFEVYEDFLFYKSGVYVYTKGKGIGGHAVRLLGWGIKDKLPYWLAANSWGRDWGDNGFFKILRGENHLGIEDEVVSGVPFRFNH